MGNPETPVRILVVDDEPDIRNILHILLSSRGYEVDEAENGLCPKGEPITVKVSGGDLIVTYDDDGVRLTGNAELAFTGVTTY